MVKFQSKSYLRAFLTFVDALSHNKKFENAYNQDLSLLKDEIWLLCGSRNQYLATRFIYEAHDNIQYFHIGKKHCSEPSFDITALLDLEVEFRSFRNVLICALIRRPKIILKYLPLFLGNIAYYSYFVNLIERYRPPLIIVSNDHYPLYRSVLLAAKKIGVKTVYVQHANVTQDFPSLVSDYALLDGKIAEEMYTSGRSTETDVRLIGAPRLFAEQSPSNIQEETSLHRSRKGTIGVAYSILDDLKCVETLLKRIRNELPNYQIILRPHPADDRALMAIVQDYGISVSDSKHENSAGFLKRIEFLIAGDSGIHLDAAANTVRPIAYSFTPNTDFEDYYGFLSCGLSSGDDPIRVIKSNSENTAGLDAFRKIRGLYIESIAVGREGDEVSFALEKMEGVIYK